MEDCLGSQENKTDSKLKSTQHWHKHFQSASTVWDELQRIVKSQRPGFWFHLWPSLAGECGWPILILLSFNSYIHKMLIKIPTSWGSFNLGWLGQMINIKMFIRKIILLREYIYLEHWFLAMASSIFTHPPPKKRYCSLGLCCNVTYLKCRGQNLPLWLDGKAISNGRAQSILFWGQFSPLRKPVTGDLLPRLQSPLINYTGVWATGEQMFNAKWDQKRPSEGQGWSWA